VGGVTTGTLCAVVTRRCRVVSQHGCRVVPRVGIEPTLLAERDFESRASTNFATEAGAGEGRILPQSAHPSGLGRQQKGQTG
jgi:hypothetical protein